MQRERRRDPYPLTWEIPVAVVVAAVLVLVVGVHLGRAVAVAVSGEGWGWPTRSELFVTLPRVLAGDAHAGLSGRQGAATGVGLLRACIAVLEVVLLVVCAALFRFGLVRWGPRRLQGMATRTEAQHLLGASRLRATKAIIRPGPLRRPAASRFDPTQVGWRVGTSYEPRGGALWVQWDRTAGVIGPQGCGKTLDLLTPALLAAPGAALVTLTKNDDLLLSLTARSTGGRPCVVLDPFGQAPGVPELIWDPIAGCVDPMVAERRAKAFTAGRSGGRCRPGTAMRRPASTRRRPRR